MVALAGCSLAGQQPGKAQSAAIEPRSDLDPGQGCDLQFARAKVNALFFALNAGDLPAVAKMFPNNSTWQFTASPDSRVAVSSGGGIRIEPRPDLTSRLLAAVNKNDLLGVQEMFPAAGGWDFELAPPFDLAIIKTPETKSVRVTSYQDLPNRVDMRTLLAQFAGLHLTFTAPPEGRGGEIDHVSPRGTVWVREAGVGVMWQATGPKLEQRGKRFMSGGGKITIYCENGLFSKVGLGTSRVDDRVLTKP